MVDQICRVLAQSPEEWAAAGTWFSGVVTLILAWAALAGLKESRRATLSAQRDRGRDALNEFQQFLVDFLARPRGGESKSEWIHDMWSRWQPLYWIKQRRLDDPAIEDRVERFHRVLWIAARDVSTLDAFNEDELRNEAVRNEHRLLWPPGLIFRLHAAATALRDDLVAFDAGDRLPSVTLPHVSRAEDYLTAFPPVEMDDFALPSDPPM